MLNVITCKIRSSSYGEIINELFKLALQNLNMYFGQRLEAIGQHFLFIFN